MAGLRLAEVAPAAPLLEALPFLLALAGLIIVAGIIKFLRGFVHAMFWGIEKGTGWIPFAGHLVVKSEHSIEQHISGWLASAERDVDSYIGYCWHNMAHLIRWTVREIERLSALAAATAFALAFSVTPKEALKLIRLLLHPLRTFQLIERKLLHLLRVAEHGITHTITAGVWPRIGVLEGEVARIEDWTIPRLRARERALTNRLTRLWKWVRAHEKIVVTSAFVGAVAVALGRLGMGWARCNNWKRIGRHVCGLPLGLIEDLLGLALAFLVVVDPVDIAKAAILTEDEMHALVTKIADAHG